MAMAAPVTNELRSEHKKERLPLITQPVLMIYEATDPLLKYKDRRGAGREALHRGRYATGRRQCREG